MEKETKFNWKVFLTLWVASVLGLLAVLPYALKLQESVIKQVTATIPLGVLIAAQVIQSILLFGAATSLGLLLAKQVGLGAPVLEKFFAGEKLADHVRPFLLPVILFGVIGGLLIFGLDKFVFMPALQSELVQGSAASGSATTPLQGFLASFYGGIDEEILLRLFLMSLLAWLGKFVSRTAEGKPTTGVLWTANILAAVFFGLGHLPATAALMTITPLVVVRAIVLNGLLGVGFGYFYTKYGLESAMLSHFSADIILHVVFSI
ncbi:MAG: CPBP family glutamic-type intramembrane protease [Anaerolineales bacterium]